MAAFSPHDIRQASTQSSPKPVDDAGRASLLALAEVMTRQSAAPAYSPIVLAGIVRLLDFLIEIGRAHV